MRLQRIISVLIPILSAAVSAETVGIGNYPAKIVPEQVAVLPAPDRGIVTDLASPDGRLERGSVIAIINRDRMAEEREDMELQIIRERINKKDEIRKLKAEKRRVNFYLGLSPEERRYAGDMVKEDDAPPTRESLADINERLELLQRELNTMERRKHAEFDKRNAANTLRMPFTGRLQYNISVPEDLSQPIEMTGAVQNFATVCDDSAFYITVNISRAELTQLPPEKFTAEVDLPGGRVLRGEYAYRRVERAGGGSGDMLIYFFRLPAEEYETAYSMLGSNAEARLLYEAGEGVQRVSKAELAAKPQASGCESWAELVQTVYPEHRVVIVAERDIIICPAAAEQP